MRRGFDLYFLFFYLSVVLMSFLMLTGLYNDFRLRRPYLVDKKWERILWLISCFAFIPLAGFFVKLPSFFFGEIKKIIKGE